MGKITGFLEFTREKIHKEPVEARLKHWREFEEPTPEETLRTQGARCMDCGIPFCHKGCPLGNIIPDWNDLVYRGRWREAIERLHSTNNFPEFTGRICPAPCEEACVLNINDDPVTIKNIEKHIIDRAFAEGWVAPQVPERKTGKTVAVIGSGPAGMACAQQLARAGHDVVLFERDDRIGGLLRYGIPDFKMEKWLIDRRMEQMAAEGVTFRTGVHAGVDLTGDELRRDFDAVVLSVGATRPRDLPVPGRELRGIHFAMEFLPQQNKVGAGDRIEGQILATGKRVVILGGGDTGSDCLGTSNRQGAASVHQFELLPQPPADRPQLAWPNWPMILRTSSSHEEGVIRDWSINTTCTSWARRSCRRARTCRPPDTDRESRIVRAVGNETRRCTPGCTRRVHRLGRSGAGPHHALAGRGGEVASLASDRSQREDGVASDHLFASLVLGALGCLAILGIGRAMMLSARGVRIIAIDRERTVPQGLADLGFVLSFLLWVYEVLAFTLPLGLHLVPAAGRASLLDVGAAKALGVLVMAAGLAVYGLALHAFGSSWRLGIDRERAGVLVTGGIFGRSRNPVYLGLALLAVGVFLVLGRLVLLLLAIVFLVYFQFLIRREERFLAEHYGDAYREYTRSVGRWWTWRPGEGARR